MLVTSARCAKVAVLVNKRDRPCGAWRPSTRRVGSPAVSFKESASSRRWLGSLGVAGHGRPDCVESLFLSTWMTCEAGASPRETAAAPEC